MFSLTFVSLLSRSTSFIIVMRFGGAEPGVIFHTVFFSQQLLNGTSHWVSMCLGVLLGMLNSFWDLLGTIIKFACSPDAFVFLEVLDYWLLLGPKEEVTVTIESLLPLNGSHFFVARHPIIHYRRNVLYVGVC